MPVTIDDVRTYWDDRPCNVRHSEKEVGTREYFDEVERKDILLNLTYHPLQDFLILIVRKF